MDNKIGLLPIDGAPEYMVEIDNAVIDVREIAAIDVCKDTYCGYAGPYPYGFDIHLKNSATININENLIYNSDHIALRQRVDSDRNKLVNLWAKYICGCKHCPMTL